MKKLVVLAVLILTSVSMFSQITSQGKPNVLKSFRMGVCKLIDTNGSITIEAQTRESASYNLIIHLGTPEEAEATLSSLAEYKPSKGETVNLNNPGGNTAHFQKLIGVWVIEETIGKYFSITVSRGELRKMSEALAE